MTRSSWLSKRKKSVVSNLRIVIHRILPLVFTGSISTPGWDGVTSYFFAMYTRASVRVPEGHVVMVSVLHMDIPGTYSTCSDFYAAWSTHPEGSIMEEYLCGNTIPGPKLYESNLLIVFFSAVGNSMSIRGFKIQFSFYPRSARPLRLPDGTWNCSVANWPDFRHHFPCNLHAECARGEDEEQCPYTSDLCGPGLLTIGGRCYFYGWNTMVKGFDIINPNRNEKRSWVGDEKECQSVGTRLASLGSYQEMSEVRKLLYKTDTPVVFVGLIPVDASAPYL